MNFDIKRKTEITGQSDLSGVCEMPSDTKLLRSECWVPSPNFEARRGQGKIDMLLMHYTATPTNAYALELLTSPEAGVSSHYLIDGEGRIFQLVGEQYRAWHAGEACWGGEVDINSCSIGIEIQNSGAALARVPAYGRRQMEAVVALAKDIVARHKIVPQRVLAHSDVAPHRKQDPGAHFNWKLLAEEGVGLWGEVEIDRPLEPVGFDEMGLSAFQDKLSLFGYELEKSGVFDARCQLVVTAFQRHYRPLHVSGIIDRETAALIDVLLDQIKT